MRLRVQNILFRGEKTYNSFHMYADLILAEQKCNCSINISQTTLTDKVNFMKFFYI